MGAGPVVIVEASSSFPAGADAGGTVSEDDKNVLPAPIELTRIREGSLSDDEDAFGKRDSSDGCDEPPPISTLNVGVPSSNKSDDTDDDENNMSRRGSIVCDC